MKGVKIDSAEIISAAWGLIAMLIYKFQPDAIAGWICYILLNLYLRGRR
jgi:hypothetical protein